MIRTELIKRSPIRILEQTIHGGLGQGNLGVFASKKGVGKTACLVHFATDHLLRGEKALHISFSDDPHHIANWYKQVYEEVAKSYKLEESALIFEELLRDRLILHFKDPKTEFATIENKLKIYILEGGFKPAIIIVDGLNFADISKEDLHKWQKIAAAYQAQIWFSASVPLHQPTISEFIEPLLDLFSVVIELKAQADHIQLILLKDHNSLSPEKLRLRLDPKTLLISNRRV